MTSGFEEEASGEPSEQDNGEDASREVVRALSDEVVQLLGTIGHLESRNCHLVSAVPYNNQRRGKEKKTRKEQRRKNTLNKEESKGEIHDGGGGNRRVGDGDGSD